MTLLQFNKIIDFVDNKALIEVDSRLVEGRVCYTFKSPQYPEWAVYYENNYQYGLRYFKKVFVKYLCKELQLGKKIPFIL